MPSSGLESKILVWARVTNKLNFANLWALEGQSMSTIFSIETIFALEGLYCRFNLFYVRNVV